MPNLLEAKSSKLLIMDDDFEELLARLTYSGFMPETWAQSYARLGTAVPPPGVDGARWQQIVNDGFLLWHLWGDRMISNDWTPKDIKSLIPLIRGRDVVAMGSGDVTLLHSQGQDMPRRVKLLRRPVDGAPARWDQDRRAA